MKFQSVFILINILLIFFIAFLSMFPFFLPGGQMISVFLGSYWYLLLVLFAILICFNVFYFLNRKMYSLLEKEDWPALVLYLEEKVIRQGKYSQRLVKLLANTYMVLSDSPGVMSLENKASITKASLVDENALIFGTARILGRDYAGAARFFESKLNVVKPAERLWVRWYFSFALMLDRQYDKSSQEFTFLVKSCNSGVITGLSAYFLATNLVKALPEHKQALESAAAEGKSKVIGLFPGIESWTREIARINSDIYTAVLSKYMEETGKWLYRAD